MGTHAIFMTSNPQHITCGQQTVKIPGIRVGWLDEYLQQESASFDVRLEVTWSAVQTGVPQTIGKLGKKDSFFSAGAIGKDYDVVP